MIRLINISKEDLCTDNDHFAWWDTVTGRFLEFCDEQLWKTWNNFERDLAQSRSNRIYDIDRFRKLFNSLAGMRKK